MVDVRPCTIAGIQKSARAYSTAAASSAESPELVATSISRAFPSAVTLTTRITRAERVSDIPARRAYAIGFSEVGNATGGRKSLLFATSGTSASLSDRSSSAGGASSGIALRSGSNVGEGASAELPIRDSIITRRDSTDAIASRLPSRISDKTNNVRNMACAQTTSAIAVAFSALPRFGRAGAASVIPAGMNSPTSMAHGFEFMFEGAVRCRN